MGDIDPAFLQSIGHRPSPNPNPNPIVADTIAAEIPVIDLYESEGLVSKIGHACENWGFFQVINHGIPTELLRKIETVAKEFFDQPMEDKKKVKRDEVNAMGYHDSEHTKNVRDWKEVFDFLMEDKTEVPASYEPEDTELRILSNQWPQYPPDFRTIMEVYASEVEKLAYKLLQLISMSLGLPANKFDDYFKGQLTLIRLNHYPPCPFPNLALGVGRHKDSGTLTVLAQDDVGGLQVKRKSDGEWIPVKPTPNAYIINVGDIFQVWSNNKYGSVEHRVVVNTERERFSVPFFFVPAHHVVIKPVDELLDERNPPKYKEYNWGKFYANRNRSDFKKQHVDNIQIDHFRI